MIFAEKQTSYVLRNKINVQAEYRSKIHSEKYIKI